MEFCADEVIFEFAGVFQLETPSLGVVALLSTIGARADGANILSAQTK
jgi:hypothetical protein